MPAPSALGEASEGVVEAPSDVDVDAKTIVTEAMRVAAGICVYTNDHITLEVL